MSNETPEINVGALSEALNDKADLDMNNIPSATLSAKIAPLLESLGGGSSGIVEQGKYDTGGYCLWENGLLIQWLNIPELKHNTVATYTWWKPLFYEYMGTCQWSNHTSKTYTNYLWL